MVTFRVANNQVVVYGTAERAVKELDGTVYMFDGNGVLAGVRKWEEGDSVEGNFEVVVAPEPVETPVPPTVVVTTVPALPVEHEITAPPGTLDAAAVSSPHEIVP